MEVKPCRVCGARDRYANHQCRPCSIARKEKWRLANPEKARQSVKDSIAKKPDHYAMLRKKWNIENKEYKKILTNNRRRKLAAGKLSKGISDILLVKQKNKCAACKCNLVSHHIDHIIPIALGGDNTDDNIQLLCPSCNLRKNAKHPVEFMQSLGYLL